MQTIPQGISTSPIPDGQSGGRGEVKINKVDHPAVMYWLLSTLFLVPAPSAEPPDRRADRALAQVSMGRVYG